MKITSARIDDIRKERDEWDAAHDAAQKKYEEERDQYHAAQEAVFAPIRDRLTSDLARFNLLDFYVEVDTHYGELLRVRIQCNQDKKFDKDSALSWDFSVYIKDGELVKESGSWSGLEITTPESVESLYQTARAAEYLNSIDWDTLLRQELPNWSDYFKTEVPRNRPNFEQQMKEEEINDYVGNGTILIGKHMENPRSRAYYLIKSQTPKKFKYAAISTYELQRYTDPSIINDPITDYDDLVETLEKRWTEQTWKENLLAVLNYPFEILSEDEFNRIAHKDNN